MDKLQLPQDMDKCREKQSLIEGQKHTSLIEEGKAELEKGESHASEQDGGTEEIVESRMRKSMAFYAPNRNIVNNGGNTGKVPATCRGRMLPRNQMISYTDEKEFQEGKIQENHRES